MQFTIKNRWSGEAIFACELSAEIGDKTYGLQLGFAVKKAIDGDADLSDANLSRADLSDANLIGADLSRANLIGANLSRANLSGANLSGANLSDADLSRADLSDANLSRANLSGANLSGANLSDADLSRANLIGADLSDANLSRADLSGANLSRANLTVIRDDLWAVLSSAPTEAAAVRDALAAGKVDGSAYEGPCACLVGTIAYAQKCDYKSIPNLRPASWRPAERFFMAIRTGDTPETSQACKLAHDWTSDWIDRMQAAFAPPSKAESQVRSY